jgi:low affinity Fe/Cu permease
MARMAHHKYPGRRGTWLERFSESVSDFTGSSTAVALAISVVLVWAALGPAFAYSNTWQLVINTGTTIVTFLMVFLIQRSQNKASLAMQLKLNELVAALDGASNRLIDVESLSERELATLHRYFRELAALAAKERHLTDTHSVEDAREKHARKAKAAGVARGKS